MSKILFFADLHATVKHGLFGVGFVEQVEKTLTWVGQIAHEHEVDAVVFLGDVFHIQQSVDTPSLHTVTAGFRSLMRGLGNRRVRLIFIPGNHDMYRKDGEWRSTEIMRDMTDYKDAGLGDESWIGDQYHKVKLIDAPEVVNVGDIQILAVPYSEAGYNPEPAHFVMGHLPVSGAMFTPGGQPEDKGVDSSFGGFRESDSAAKEVLYVGGHYHHPQILGRSLIVGACCYHKYTDFIMPTPRGCVILTLDTPRTPTIRDFQWIENPHTLPVHTIRKETRQEVTAEVEMLRTWTSIPQDRWKMRVFLPSQELEHLEIAESEGIQLVPDDPIVAAVRLDISDTTDPTRVFDEYRSKVPPERMEAEIKALGDDFLRKAVTDG